MVYSWWPPLPEMDHSIAPAQRHGRDTWATMLWGVPAGFIASRSLLEHGELPLWNRYSRAGDTFIGQAISMLGDPLQVIVILGRGSAIAWDLKFLAAKFLFCAGFGILILRLGGNCGLALLYAALAAYCGAYFYIANHPVFFVFAYAPWLLLSAIGLLDLQSQRYIGWGFTWLLSNVACFNAGHIEVAVDLIGGLNLTALAYALISSRSLTDSIKVLLRIVVGTLLFVGLTAPVWLTFLGALGGAYTAHDDVQVVQLPLKCLPGLFDDSFSYLFARTNPFNPLIPETSLLIFVGCIIAIWQWRQLKHEPFFWVNSGAIVLWGGIVFGWVPAAILAAIPLLNRVGHIYTDFSYLLVIHLTIQSAYGFKSLAGMKNLRHAIIALVCLVVVLEATIALAYGYRLHQWSGEWNYLLGAAAGAVGAPLLYAYLKSRNHQFTAVQWLGICVLGFIPNYRFALYHASLGNDDPFMIPGRRVVLNASSPTVDKMKAANTVPFRVVGLGRNFFGDYSAVYGLEDIRSCAPLASSEFIKFFHDFPGVTFDGVWTITIVDFVQAQPLLNFLNVKYVLAAPNVGIRTNIAFSVTDRSDFGVIENQQVWPRAYFANMVVLLDSNEAFTKHLLANSRQPFIALTTEEIAKQPGLQQLPASTQPVITAANNYSLRPNSTEFDIHAPTAGVVCLTEGPAQDFTAKANSETKKILTVNRAFKGIYLDKAGDYHIKFTYRPRHWILACACFWISIVIVVALILGNLTQFGSRHNTNQF